MYHRYFLFWLSKDVVQMMISLLGRVENTVEKGENSGYQHFRLFSQYI